MTKIEISLKTLLIVATLILLYQFIVRIEYIIILVILAYIVMAAINPIVSRLQKSGIRSGISISAIYILLVLLIITITIFIIFPLLKELVIFFRQLPLFINKILDSYPYIKNNTVFNHNYINNISQSATGKFLNSDTGFTTLYRTALGITTVMASILSVLVMSIYMILDTDYNKRIFTFMLPSKYKEKVLNIMDKVEAKLGRWFQAQLILCFVVFILNYIALSIFRVKFALVISIIAGFMEVMPVAGPIISGVITFIITMLVNPASVFYVLGSSILIHQLEVHFLVPKIMQKVIGLSPLVTIIALLIGADLMGILGAVLSIPIAATLQIIYLETKKND